MVSASLLLAAAFAQQSDDDVLPTGKSALTPLAGPSIVGGRSATSPLGGGYGPNLSQPGLGVLPGGPRGRRAGRSGGKGASAPSFQARPGLAPPRAAAARKGRGAAGVVDPKWALIDAGAADDSEGEFRTMLTESVSLGPLTEDRAEELVKALTGVAEEILKDGGLSLLARTQVGGAETDHELTALWDGLAATLPPDARAAACFVDDTALEAWFLVLDASRDGAISFLEWRDRTQLPLALFRRIDGSGEGLLSFDEFAPALLVSAARSDECAIDPALVESAIGEPAPSAVAGAAAFGGPRSPVPSDLVLLSAASLSNEEAIRRARSELASAARYTQNAMRLQKQRKLDAATVPNPVVAPAADGSLPPGAKPVDPNAPLPLTDPKARTRNSPTNLYRPRAQLPGN